MYVNKINGIVKTYDKIPTTFPPRKHIEAYNLQPASVHFADGFRELEDPILGENQVRGRILYKLSRNKNTYTVIDLTAEEIEIRDTTLANQPIEMEYQKYLQRQEDGVSAYMRISAKFRVMKEGGVITEAVLNQLEQLVKPIREEVVLGQWKEGLKLTIALGPEGLGESLYNEIHKTLNDYVLISYA